MRQYEFVSIPLRRDRAGLHSTQDYREVVREHALRGWRFVQLVSFEAHAEPRLEMIFTRKEP